VDTDAYAEKARSCLKVLCDVKPNRRTGSPGNRDATDFFAHTIRPHGYEIDATPFEALDHVCAGALLTSGPEAYEVHPSPYTLGCDVSAELVAVSTVQELQGTNCEGKILLMRGGICSEQLMPKNFAFYNPEHHREIVALLEKRKPAGIITSTGRNPDQAGAVYPFPLIVDGDFDVPSVYCREDVGDVVAARQGDLFHLTVDARRLPSSATNVVARLNARATKKIVVTAHIDAYEGSPGASDNASGVVVLLLCAEMLSSYRGDNCIEIAALNGEDHYSAAGQMDYLKRHGGESSDTLLAVNVDDVGYKKGQSAYSFYECPPPLEKKLKEVLQRFDGLAPGAQWFNGDHMLFVQSRIPAVAFTSEHVTELMATVTHTSGDTPDIIDCQKLVEVAASISDLVRSL
jgi:aminopeptidase YwaD